MSFIPEGAVALRKESVDRNTNNPYILRPCFMVALRKESVDRNASALQTLPCWVVALRKESVDRNLATRTTCTSQPASLSARRAWIEILPSWGRPGEHPPVALRKESVDRNLILLILYYSKVASLSARRAWIEIQVYFSPYCSGLQGRSPQGERG